MMERHCNLVDETLWSRRREEFYRRFLEDVEIGYADKDIVDFINLVFSKKGVFTTSSCSGRITLVDALYPWLRDEAYVVFKKHEPISVEEISNLLSQNPIHRFWLISSGPILHFVAIDLEKAHKILQIARNSGFKHSGIISVSNEGIVVEIISGTWTSFLIKDSSKLIVNELDDVVKVANEVLIEGKKRLEKLYKAFKEVDI
uniref:tRNA(Phe) 7-((3-amino-3-carboxypropyl)-4-demethylwyosine(37)-N(4))-methyltransferase n=1 Tax=Ignisphaera aggregans TaxID=334771 RepID=A0A7C2VHG4_9CREN